MAAIEERLDYTPEQEINFLYMIAVGELTQQQVHTKFNIGKSSLKTRIAKIKETLKTVSYIEDTVLYSELNTLDQSLVTRLVRDSLIPATQKKRTTNLPTTTTKAMPASISEITPYGTLPAISRAFRTSLNNSGVASPDDLSECLAHQKENKSTRLLKCNDTMTSPSTNVGTLRNLISTKKSTLPSISTKKSALPSISKKKKPIKKMVMPGRIPDAALIVQTQQKPIIPKPYHYLAHDQSSSEEEDD